MSQVLTSTPRARRRWRPGAAVAASLLVAAVLAVSPPAGAETVTRTGSLSGDDPTMGVVTIDGDSDVCIAQTDFPVHYETIPFTARAAGHYTFALTSPSSFASLYLYQDSFDPLDGLTNCIAADNSADNDAQQTIVELDAAAPRDYVVVVFDDTGEQSGGDYELVIDTPDGVATSPNEGSGKRFARFGASYTCPAPHTGQVTWSKRAAKVDEAVFKAGTQVVRSVRTATAGDSILLRNLPDSTRKLTGVITLKNGDRHKVVRQYYRC